MAKQIFGLIGRTLKHSYSVQIHQELGNAHYQLYELEPEQVPSFIQRPDIGGLNVTIPYKQTVIPYCTELSPVAQAIGSVNTLVRRADGSLYGHNTDACGLEYMAQRAGIQFENRKVLIFGSGGASLTAQAVATQQGAKQIIVVSRHGENNYGNLAQHADAEILINATPVGMYPQVGVMVADPAAFPHCQGVLDLIYNPRRTAFLQAAERANIPCSDGLPMLVEQARAAAELFLQCTIPDKESERILHKLRQQTENIVLIGMPGCGKSSIGAALAQYSGRPAIDIDAEIVRNAGCSIPDIFAQQGEAGFRQLERQQIAQAGMQRGCILITGGGVVKDAANYAPLHQNGRIYHLSRPLELLEREGRPLSENADLELLYKERLPLYQRFRDVEIANNSSIKEAAERIWRDFCEHTGT